MEVNTNLVTIVQSRGFSAVQSSMLLFYEPLTSSVALRLLKVWRSLDRYRQNTSLLMIKAKVVGLIIIILSDMIGLKKYSHVEFSHLSKSSMRPGAKDESYKSNNFRERVLDMPKIRNRKWGGS